MHLLATYLLHSRSRHDPVTCHQLSTKAYRLWWSRSRRYARLISCSEPDLSEWIMGFVRMLPPRRGCSYFSERTYCADPPSHDYLYCRFKSSFLAFCQRNRQHASRPGKHYVPVTYYVWRKPYAVTDYQVKIRVPLLTDDSSFLSDVRGSKFILKEANGVICT